MRYKDRTGVDCEAINRWEILYCIFSWNSGPRWLEHKATQKMEFLELPHDCSRIHCLLLTKCVYVTTNRKEQEKESGNWNGEDGNRFWPVRGLKTWAWDSSMVFWTHHIFQLSLLENESVKVIENQIGKNNQDNPMLLAIFSWESGFCEREVLFGSLEVGLYGPSVEIIQKDILRWKLRIWRDRGGSSPTIQLSHNYLERNSNGLEVNNSLVESGGSISYDDFLWKSHTEFW